jgi:hypothetical protein
VNAIKEKSRLWWIFIWPVYRNKIRKLWEKGYIRLCVVIIKGLFNDTDETAKYITEWLSKVHNWKVK